MSLTDSPTMLRYLDILLKHGNYTRAAKELFISQPYLTQAIKKVEQQLGTEIIDRQAGHLHLTEAGNVYYQYLEALELQAAELQKKLEVYTQPNQIKIQVGILSSLGIFLLPLFLPNYQKDQPKVKLLLNENLPKINENKVLKGEIDFFIGQNPEAISPNLKVYECSKESYYAVIPKFSHFYRPGVQFLEPESIPLKKLLQEKFILTSSGSAIRRQMDQLFQKYGIIPQIALESSNIYTVVELAKNNLGLAIAPESVIFSLEQGSYNLFPISDELSLSYFIAHRIDKTLSEAEEEFVASFLAGIQQKNLPDK
ncbi:LysR family transcriptional regulator [Enterococcus dongliensis]|uniref:LysR family transcriptional regulator n=1 Tax=Enterococcus dongliensis TaxID=2559925 RepID=UPI0028910723|nr:LysR family transcriptional regulator [Enterococcus dongliensis]MDT2669265.1 LysR family transcriptional regulator [Enterococcus dongliensis]